MCKVISISSIRKGNQKMIDHTAVPISYNGDSIVAKYSTSFGVRTLTLSRKSLREAASKAMAK